MLRGRNPSSYVEEGIPVIRAVDLRDITDLSNVLYASPSETLFYLKEDDILISSIGAGSIGKVELFEDSGKKVATVSEVSVVRVKDFAYDPAALSLFLKSRFGYLQIERRITGSTGQLHLYPNDISTILVPIFDKRTECKLSEAVKESLKLLRDSKSLYRQAEELLLKELGLDKFRLSQPKYWTVKLSRAKEFHRLDAEHFQPKYDKLLRHLQKTSKAKYLGEIVSYNKRGLQPTYVEGGEIIVVNSQHLGRYLLNIEATERTDESFWQTNARCRLKRGDILFYSTGAYVGRTNVYLEDHKAIASNHVAIIRTKEGINPLFISVFLNALPGLLQAEKWASGSGQREVYPEDIARFVIPVLPQSFQEKIADLVTKSHQARQKAKALLEEAKQKVEAMIEGKT